MGCPKVLRKSSAVDSPGPLASWVARVGAPAAQGSPLGLCDSKGQPETAAPVKSALLQSRLSCRRRALPSPPQGSEDPEVESPAGAGSAGISDVARLEIHTHAALQNTSFNGT
jgi:hypothetical protein